jgi:cyclin E
VISFTGITCLFVAAKLEEIYPPNLKTFAYVTDGACTESEILDMELVLMKTLKWKLTPITPVSWISIYLQVLAYKNQGVYCTRSGADAFLRSTLRPQDSKPDDARLVKYMYDMVEFVKVVRIVDLAILDTHSLQFSYSTMAAAALFHIKGIIRTYYFKHRL